MRRSLAIAGLCIALSSVAVGQSNPDRFPDIPENHWVYEKLAYLKSVGMLTGYPDGLIYRLPPRTRYDMAEAVTKALAGAHRIVSSLQRSNDEIALVAGSETQDKSILESEKRLKAEIKGWQTSMPDWVKELRAMTVLFTKELTALGVAVPKVTRQFRQDCAALAALRPAKIGEALQPFPDVLEKHWASQATRNLRSQLVLRGDAKGRFGG